MGSRRLFLSLLFFFVFSLLGRTSLATKKVYVIYLGSHDHGPEPNHTHFAKAEEYHYELLASVLGSKEKANDALLLSYTKYINGFAAKLDEEEVAKLRKHPDVISVFLSMTRRLHTTHSWQFLGVDQIEAEPWWKNTHTGSDVIIGSLDTGVWPESESFKDDGMGPVPSRWKGSCQNNTKEGVPCNRKLIGAKYFDQGYREMMAELYDINPVGNLSARDTVGHGTHTLSTAAGRPVPNANLFGFGSGTARGPLPNARVAAYKVCWPPINENSTECCDVDILAGFDAAIHDGVDIISASIAQPTVNLDGEQMPYWMDATAIGSFHAVKHGIVVVCSAGNDGPTAGVVSNVAPWIITVGASVMDRGFSNYVQLGNNKVYKGQSLSTSRLPEEKQYPLVNAGRSGLPEVDEVEALLCKPGTLDPEKVRGKIVVCIDGDFPRLEKAKVVADAGGAGMVLLNSCPTDVYPELYQLPASHVFANATFIVDYIADNPNPTALITNPVTDYELNPAPALACFSSRGPNALSDILKPDIIAPGMSILASFSPEAVPSDLQEDKRRVLFNVVSGTSMASPHVAGIVGIIKTAHPEWSPSEIKSALMTTARTRDKFNQTIRDQCTNHAEADPFGYGAGHVRPIRALDPGLVYGLAMHDYWNFFCSMDYKAEQFAKFFKKSYACPKSSCILDFNYPAITVSGLTGTVTLSRVLKNVGTPGTYNASIIEPWGISVTVKPKSLKFEKVGEKKMFWLTIKAKEGMRPKTHVFGKLKWYDGTHDVRSPIAVKLEEPEVEAEQQI